MGTDLVACDPLTGDRPGLAPQLSRTQRQPRAGGTVLRITVLLLPM
jgi:hypothetical protein